ncbi:EAL domain-containing protein [Hippea sp. KM1]|uniref:EAL domain-containing protein n=1 Tax=Hippea sp. KM1 TaxID=944481 RepID=UPI00046D0115|nr:EAL domain-containing protein [Hippea sp. KM1]
MMGKIEKSKAKMVSESPIFDIFKTTGIVGVFIYQEGGRVVFANDVAARIFGFENGNDFIGKSFLDFIHSHKEEIIEAVKGRTSTTPRINGLGSLKEYREIAVKNNKNAFVWIDSFTYSITYEGKPSGLAILIDRTKEKTYQALFEALSRIESVVLKETDEDSLLKKVCSIVVDEIGFEGCLLLKTESGGLSASTAKIRQSAQLDHLIDLFINKNPFFISEIAKNRVSVLVPDVLRDAHLNDPDGILRDCNIHPLYAIPILKNSISEYILLVMSRFKGSFDESHLRLLEELKETLSFSISNIDLKNESVLLNRAIEASPNWFLVADRNGRILRVNEAVEAISGYSKEELIGKSVSIFKSNKRDVDFYKNLWKTINSGKIWRGVLPNKTKSGSVFYLDETILPIFKNNRPFKFVSLARDITKEVSLKKTLKIEVKLYGVLYHLTKLSLNLKNQEEFLKQSIKILADIGDFEVAFIADCKMNIRHIYAKDSRYKNIPQTLSETLKQLKNKDIAHIPALKAIKYNRVYIQSNMKSFKVKSINDMANKKEIGSCCAIPIITKNNEKFVVVLISKRIGFFDKKSYKLLEIIKQQLSSTLSKLHEEMFHKMILTALDWGFDFIVVLDKNFNIIYSNKTAENLSGYTKEELIGQHHSIFSTKNDDREYTKRFYESLSKGKPFSGVLSHRKKDGTVIDFINTIVPYKVNGRIEYFIAAGKQLTNEEQLMQELNHIIHYDRLTSLPNYNTFMESLERFIVRAKAEKLVGAVAIINPISFKSINEAFGFETGNEVLKAIGKRLKESVYKYDIAAKLESERFGVILKDLKFEENVATALARIMNNLKEPYNIENKTIHLSFNIGISLFPKDGNEAKDLLDKAQIALADAKIKGENQLGFFRKDFETTATRILKLKSQLHLALERNEFTPFFQPYVDSKEKICGAESLLRWKNDSKLIPPMEFIPYLEQTDLIKAVEMQVVEEVIKIIKNHRINIPISVNLSTKSLNKENLYGEISSRIDRYGIKPSLLKLEIVERAFIENFTHLNNLIERLKTIGVSFSIDDFGTGYSSLSYLSRLKIESLKIDISFTKEITHSKHTRNIVESIIFLSKKLGIKTIAEGIEKKEQFDILKDMGCDYFQGYFFFRPMPEEEFRRIA